MREERDNIRCDVAFGRTGAEALVVGQRDGSLPIAAFISVNNPTPTGDHWRSIGWVLNFRKKGPQAMAKMPASRRDFVKRAAAALDTGGFYMELVSATARKFRDDSGLRMQRGKVFAFVTLRPETQPSFPSPPG